MSDSGKIPTKDASVNGKNDPSLYNDGFVPLTSLWEEPKGKTEAEEREDFLKELRDRELAARRQAEEIISTARGDAGRIEQEAYQKGFAQGNEQGHAEGKKSYDEAVQRLEALMSAVNNQLAEKNNRYEEELLALVNTMVDRLVHHEVSTNSRVIQACFKRALSFVVEKSVARVHLHPDDFIRIREASLANPALLDGKSRIELIEDGSISEGGCLMETDFGDIDATLDYGREKLADVVSQAFRASIVEDSDAVAK